MRNAVLEWKQVFCKHKFVIPQIERFAKQQMICRTTNDSSKDRFLGPDYLYRISPCIIHTFFTQKVAFKIGCIHYKGTQNFQVFSPKISKPLRLRNLMTISTGLQKHNTDRTQWDTAFWIPSKYPADILSSKNLILGYFLSNFGLSLFIAGEFSSLTLNKER